MITSIQALKRIWFLPVRADDILRGFGGADTLDGGDGADDIDGWFGNDRLIGGAGDDIVLGGGNNDTIIDRQGADSLDGGAGQNTLRGGTGADTFQFTASSLDTSVRDFNLAEGDRIEIFESDGFRFDHWERQGNRFTLHFDDGRIDVFWDAAPDHVLSLNDALVII